MAISAGRRDRELAMTAMEELATACGLVYVTAYTKLLHDNPVEIARRLRASRDKRFPEN